MSHLPDVGLAEMLNDEAELQVRDLGCEEGFSVEELSEDAAAGPDVDGGGVEVADEEELGGPVVAHGDVLGQVDAFGWRVGSGRWLLLEVLDAAPGESEVAELDVAVLVDEYVVGLEVAVHDACRVHVAHHAQQLVHEVGNMVVRQWLGCVDDLLQV